MTRLIIGENQGYFKGNDGTMRIMNFGFIVEKEGRLRALPSTAGDVLAVLEAMGILAKRWKSLSGFMSEDKLEKIDLLLKIYYPIYLVREGKYVIPVDGMGIHEVRVEEFSEIRNKYAVHHTKTYNFPLIGNGKLEKWIRSAVEGQIQDGYAIPQALTREEAIFISKEVIRIYLKLKEYLDKLRSSLESYDKKLREDLEKIFQERRGIEERYEKGIAEKNLQIESLLIDSEKHALRKIEEEFKKRAESLRNERKGLEELVKSLTVELKSIDDKMDKIKGEISQIRKEIARIETKKERLMLEKKKVEESRAKFDNIKSILKDLEDCEKMIEVYKRNEESSLRSLSELQEKRNRILKRAEEVRKTISRLVDEEKILPSRRDLELRKAREEFTEKRNEMIKGLNALLAERDNALWNLRARENKLKFEYKRFREFSEEKIRVLEEELTKLDAYIWKNVELGGDVELLYIPYYITYKNERLVLIEPPIVVKGLKKIEDFKDIGVRRELIEAILESWDVISVILFDAKEVFDVLSTKNKSRILEGINFLKEVGAIDRFQEAVLLKECVSSTTTG